MRRAFTLILGRNHRKPPVDTRNFSFIAIEATLSPTNKTGDRRVKRKKKEEGPRLAAEKSDMVGLRAIRAAWRFNEPSQCLNGRRDDLIAECQSSSRRRRPCSASQPPTPAARNRPNRRKFAADPRD